MSRIKFKNSISMLPLAASFKILIFLLARITYCSHCIPDNTGLQNVKCFLSHKKNKVIVIAFCMLNSNITLVSFYHARFSSDTHFKLEENVCFEQFAII
jgi:hypothetical protein